RLATHRGRGRFPRMNRKILMQVAAPAVVIGLLLFVACLVGARSMSRLQENRAKIVQEHVLSLEAAQGLEIHLRQLRFQCFLSLLQPDPDRLKEMYQIHRDFEAALDKARHWAESDEEWECINAIQEGYAKYHGELALLSREAGRPGPRET